jgi:hypothetical protein
MSAQETSSNDRLPADQDFPAGEMPASTTGGVAASRSLAGPLAMIGGGLLAGILGWLILESTFPFFCVLDDVLARIPLSFPTVEDLAEFRAEKQVVDLKNATATGLLLGALVAGVFAVAQAAVRGFRRSFLPLACCIACGSVAGAAGGLVGQVWLYRLLGTTDPMTAVVVFQGAFWAILGAGTGLGVGSFSGSAGRLFGLLGQGLLVGAVFGLVYAAGAAYVFPIDDAERLVPASLANRAVWAVAGTGLIGLLLGTASDRRRRRPRES